MGSVLTVASDFGALHDWLGHGRGVLMPMVGADGLTDNGAPDLDLRALVSLLNDGPRLQKKLKKARRWAQAQTWAKRGEQWSKLFEQSQANGEAGASAYTGQASGTESQPQLAAPPFRYRDWFAVAVGVGMVLITIGIRSLGLL